MTTAPAAAPGPTRTFRNGQHVVIEYGHGRDVSYLLCSAIPSKLRQCRLGIPYERFFFFASESAYSEKTVPFTGRTSHDRPFPFRLAYKCRPGQTDGEPSLAVALRASMFSHGTICMALCSHLHLHLPPTTPLLLVSLFHYIFPWQLWRLLSLERQSHARRNSSLIKRIQSLQAAGVAYHPASESLPLQLSSLSQREEFKSHWTAAGQRQDCQAAETERQRHRLLSCASSVVTEQKSARIRGLGLIDSVNRPGNQANPLQLSRLCSTENQHVERYPRSFSSDITTALT